MVAQIRTYTINKGMMDSWLELFDKEIRPVHEGLGIPIVATYVSEDVKPPWYIDLLNINLDNHDLQVGQQKIHDYLKAFRADGTRITEDLDFGG